MIEYRKANQNDIDELVRLRIEFLKEVQKIESDHHDPHLKMSLVNYFRGTINNNSFIAWLALDIIRLWQLVGCAFILSRHHIITRVIWPIS
jgi:hypothetical protein